MQVGSDLSGGLGGSKLSEKILDPWEVQFFFRASVEFPRQFLGARKTVECTKPSFFFGIWNSEREDSAIVVSF